MRDSQGSSVENIPNNRSVIRSDDYVTGRAFTPLLQLADEKGWTAELLTVLPGTYSETDLRNPRARIDWRTYVAFATRFEETAGEQGLADLAQIMAPSYTSMARFMGLMTSPRMVYKFVNRWAGPSTFPLVQQTTEEIDQHTIRVWLRIPESLEDCPTFFRITRLMFQAAPNLVGDKSAAVELKVAPRCGEFLIHMPPSSTIWSRVSRAFRAFFSGASVLDELVSQHDRLLLSYQELQQAHAELERSEQNFRTLIEESPLATLVLGEDRIVYANNAMSRFLRRSANDSLVGQKISGFLLKDDAVQRFVERVDFSTAGGADVEFRADDGEIVVGHVKSITTRWDGNNVRLLVCEDVTERNRVMTRATELDRMIAMGTLAAGVAHEINNPLAFIHSNLEYASEVVGLLRTKLEIEDERVERLEQALRESLGGTTRVREIVKDLKSFSRAPEERLERTNLRDVAQSAMSMSWPEVRRAANLRNEFNAVPEVMANDARLGQVVLNLLVNAAQAFPAGKEDRNFITVRTISRGDTSVIEVEDNATGIPPESLRHIFDPFFTTKPLGEGTGMGLWISRNIVTNLGGRLEVESEWGRGSCFRIIFPHAPPVEEEEPIVEELPPRDAGLELAHPLPSSASAPDKLPRVRVLVVDDEPMIGRLIERILPHDVVAFTDPHAALRRLREDDSFDVILCDATMPGMTGREFLRRIRGEYPALAPKFVLITGGLTSSWEEDPDAPPIVTKPFNMNALRSIVQQIADAAAAAE